MILYINTFIYKEAYVRPTGRLKSPLQFFSFSRLSLNEIKLYIVEKEREKLLHHMYIPIFQIRKKIKIIIIYDNHNIIIIIIKMNKNKKKFKNKIKRFFIAFSYN
jgi:hypothetical protein